MKIETVRRKGTKIINEAMLPRMFLGVPFPRKILSRKPASGSTGISQASCSISFGSPFKVS
jgi:hypothetical protein